MKLDVNKLISESIASVIGESGDDPMAHVSGSDVAGDMGGAEAVKKSKEALAKAAEDDYELGSDVASEKNGPVNMSLAKKASDAVKKFDAENPKAKMIAGAGAAALAAGLGGLALARKMRGAQGKK